MKLFGETGTFGKVKKMLTGVGILIVAVLCVLFGMNSRMSAENADTIEDGPMILVLNYHKVDWSFNSLSVPPEDFDRQMRYLKDAGYETITPQELQDALSGKTELPQHPVLITFDDGYLDNYTNAYPILKKYNMKATIFVVAGYPGVYPGYLTWDQMREMEQNGMHIESHTMNHIPLEELTDDQIRQELQSSKQKLESELGHSIKYIAYPTGTYNLHIANLAKEAGYEAAYTIKYGNVDLGSNLFALERVPIFHTENTMGEFHKRLTYRPLFEEQGWKMN